MTEHPVRFEIERDIAVLTIDNPPVNALGHAVREALADGLSQVEANADIRAAVILGAGRTFIAGADIKEFGKPTQPPSLPEVIAQLDAMHTPVIAALHGTALGGGLEVALGCHFRIALKATKVGLPEVKLGILPGAGGTQRLPRLAGAKRALDMMTTGNFVGADEARVLGIIDDIAQGDDVRAAGLSFARHVIDTNQPVKRVRDLPAPINDPDLYASYREKLEVSARGLFSPFRIVDCVEAAANLPFDEGLAAERTHFQACMDSPQRSGLIHAFFAERAATKNDDIPKDTPVRRLETAAALGTSQAAADLIRAMEKAGIEPGDGGSADIVICADPAQSADAADGAKPGALLISLGMPPGAQASGRAEDWLGLILPDDPACRLAEIACGPKAAADTRATGAALAKRLGLIGLPVRAGDHGVVARLALAYQRFGEALQAQGYDAADIDGTCVQFGMARGPCGGTMASAGQTDSAITDRLLHDLGREGERILSDGQVQRPLDIDIAALHTLGFPAYRGGPMFAVGMRG